MKLTFGNGILTYLYEKGSEKLAPAIRNTRAQNKEISALFPVR